MEEIPLYNSEPIRIFREYLRIQSVHPNPDYGSCLEFLKKQASQLGLPFEIVPLAAGKTQLGLMSWLGTEPQLPSVLLTSHMDVVPVNEEHWTHKPFSADVDEQGNIYARGAQDMKCVTIQYLEAIRRMISKGVFPKRSVHLCFTPDEEIGSENGMKAFIKTDKFRELNIGVAMDEGLALQNESCFNLAYGEKCNWLIKITCPGTAGHASILLPNTAGPKLTYMLGKLDKFRKSEEYKLIENPQLDTGEITSLNITIISGGVQGNVLPMELTATVDFRIPGHLANSTFENMLQNWCKEAGEGVTIEYLIKDIPGKITELNPSNPWWVNFKRAADQMKIDIRPIISSGVADGRFLRQLGLPVFNFSPINYTEPRLHADDECLNVEVFLRGIDIYEKLISALFNS